MIPGQLDARNASTKEGRLAALQALLEETTFPEQDPCYVNNHIHTTYSFSPYSPTAAVFAARQEGLCTAGIVDHESLGGAEEFLRAAQMADLAATVGLECRASMKGTRVAHRRTNSCDQIGISYMTIQSIPHERIAEVQDFFALYRAAREERNRKMVTRLSDLGEPFQLSYEKDIRPLSMVADGGTVSERHILFALCQKWIHRYGKGEELLRELEKMAIPVRDTQKRILQDVDNPYYAYDLLGVLKTELLGRFYVNAEEECPPLSLLVSQCKKWDAWLCYAYLGDIQESVTGDKIAQAYEDTYLEELFVCLQEEGVTGITYMPTRNTTEQLLRVRSLCETYGMFEVSGEDINAPRQHFAIAKMKDPLFSNLIDATWTMIRHESETSGSAAGG